MPATVAIVSHIDAQRGAHHGRNPPGQGLPPARSRATVSAPVSESPSSHNTSVEQKLAARANSGVANALAAAAAGGFCFQFCLG